MNTLTTRRASAPTNFWRALRAVAIGTVASCGLTAGVFAQTNAERVGNIVRPALAVSCDQAASAPAGRCSLLQSGVRELSQLAPDKFMLQSKSAMTMIDRQISNAHDRMTVLLSPAGTTLMSPVTAGVASAELRSAAVAAPASPPPPPTPAAGTSPTTPTPGGGAAPSAAAGAGLQPALGWGLFIRGEGTSSTADPTSYDPGFKGRSSTATLGADYRVASTFIVGMAFSYFSNRSNLDTSDGTPSGKVETRGPSVSVYGTWLPGESAYVDAVLIAGRNRYASERFIQALTDTAVGETDGAQFAFNVGGGTSFQFAAMSLGPYARVAYSKTTIDAFTERTNASASNLTVAEQTAASLTSVLGVQLSRAFSRSWGVLVPNARLEWEHQYKGDRTSTITAAFAGTTPTMAVPTTPPDRNYFNLGLGLAAHRGVGNSALVYYQTVLGRSGQNLHALTAELRLEF